MPSQAAFVPTSLALSTRAIPTAAAAVSTAAALPRVTARTPQPALLHHAQISTTPPEAPAPARTPSRILLWLHTDLRLSDNAALRAAASAAAAPGGALVPVAAGAALHAHAAPLLAELKARLQALGSDVLAAPGRIDKALLQVCKRLNLGAVYFNRSVHRSRVRAERRVIDALTRAGVQVEAFWGNNLAEPEEGTLRRDSKIGVRDMAKLLREKVAHPMEAPQRLPGLPQQAMRMQGMRAVVAKVGGGTQAAERVLQRMDREEETLRLSERPDVAVTLKVFLDYGALSPRMVAARVLQVMGAAKGRTFSELVWREYVCVASHRAVGLSGAKSVVAA